jgi:progressive ankylosis protein
MSSSLPNERLRLGSVIATWWPLAASWLLMGLELPAVAAVMARLPDPTLSLAAYGGVVFPLILMIESPIIMLLPASTALSRDWASYHVVRRFMFLAGGLLTVLHVLVAFTPVYEWVAGTLLGIPIPVREPARWGLQILTPWTFSIAYRRTQQGVLIRFGRSHAVGIGTAIRLTANGLVLAIGFLLHNVPGIVVGSAAVAAGVMSEAVYAGLAVRRVLRDQVRVAPPVAVPLTDATFMRFYLPLMLTPIIWFVSMPLTSAAMSRMALAIESLAVWPVMTGVVFTARSLGFALNEVVVTLLERPDPVPALRRFTALLAAFSTAALLLFAVTPLGRFWFERVSALPATLADLAHTGLWMMVLMPAFSPYQSLYQGAIVHSHRTRAVTESVAVLLVTAALVLAIGIARGAVGLYVASIATVASTAAQLVWLRFRARRELAAVIARDARPAEAAAAAS